MSKPRIWLAAAMMMASATTALAGDLGNDRSASTNPDYTARSGPPRIIWFFDIRDDDKDFPTNGFFPGDFAANPPAAAFSAAGFFGHAPSSNSTSSQAAVGSQHDDGDCARRHRSYDPTSGTFVGYDHARHRC